MPYREVGYRGMTANARRGVLHMAYGDSEKTLQARARLTSFLWVDTEFDCSPAGRRIRVQP